MLIEWRPGASAALREILSYISERNLTAAINLGDEIERATPALPQHPYLYRHGKVAETREMVVPKGAGNYKCTNLLCILVGAALAAMSLSLAAKAAPTTTPMIPPVF